MQLHRTPHSANVEPAFCHSCEMRFIQRSVNPSSMRDEVYTVCSDPSYPRDDVCPVWTSSSLAKDEVYLVCRTQNKLIITSLNITLQLKKLFKKYVFVVNVGEEKSKVRCKIFFRHIYK